MLEILLKKFGTYNNTCSITDIQNKSVTFIRDEKYIPLLKNIKEDIWVIAHTSMERKIREWQESYCPTVNVHYTDYPEFEFTLYHNRINQNKTQSKPCIGNGCKIHPTVIMDVDGMKAVNTPNGEKIHFIHTGHVFIGDNVEIGPYTVIHRGTMGLTSIGSGCQIGSLNNIGHNCKVGINNVLAAGVILNGGVYTGSNCWFGSGSIIKHYLNIYDNVVIGHGAVVTKDINESGIYIGNPAKFLKPIEEGWNF
jgi:acetyltransferase-like isoleucine patch superfamily enzyme